MTTRPDDEQRGIQAPLGAKDILPEEAGSWLFIEETARKIFTLYGYSEIRVPMFENTALFRRSIGETTDIVEKEMYTFGEGQDSVTFRPEMTAGIVRAYLENSMHRKKAFQKLFSIGPAFRRERPQKGRQRQFHQLDAEALGAVDPHLDAEMIMMAVEFFHAAGLKSVIVKLNSTGCPKCKGVYREQLKKAIHAQLSALCENCKARFERNVFRILDCKEEKCRSVVAGAPKFEEHLCPECKTHHNEVNRVLSAAGVKFETDANLVRGLDYYTKTVFEIVSLSPGLGTQNAVGGGGRYDGLISELGGPELGAVGFALGIERTLLALEADLGKAPAAKEQKTVYVASVSADEKDYAFQFLSALRTRGIPADMDFEGRSLKAQMKSANKTGVVAVCIAGPDEAASGRIKIKDMESGSEEILDRSAAVEKLTLRIPPPCSR
jgi:histidyl-tRNA synthetase